MRPERGVAERAVEAAFAPPATAAQVLGGQLFDRDDLVAGRQGGGGLVDLMGPDRGHPRMNPAHPGVGPLPPFRRLPPRLGVGIVGAAPARRAAAAPPAAETAPGSTVWAPRSGPTSAPSAVATTSRSLTPTSTPTTGCWRSAGVRGAGLALNDHLKRALPAPTGETHRGRQDPRRTGLAAGGPACGSTHACGSRPIRGNTTWWRSASTRIAPVVNRTDRVERCLDLNRGKPTAAPARSPLRDCRPVLQGAGQHRPARVVGLLAVGLPPRRHRALALIPGRCAAGRSDHPCDGVKSSSAMP